MDAPHALTLMAFVIARTSTNRRDGTPRIYHLTDCPEVTSKRGSRAENWLPFDPKVRPFSKRPRPCKRCLPSAA